MVHNNIFMGAFPGIFLGLLSGISMVRIRASETHTYKKLKYKYFNFSVYFGYIQ